MGFYVAIFWVITFISAMLTGNGLVVSNPEVHEWARIVFSASFVLSVFSLLVWLIIRK